MNKDISSILKVWEFDPSDICVRKIIGQDGREKLQVRLDLGLLQMELTGRPDGSRPKGFESVLDYYLDRFSAHREEHGTEEGFRLDEEACGELWQEGMYYYHRYICFYRMEDHEGVLRDTAHNLAILDLVRDCGDDEEAMLSFEQYRPYVIMIHTRAKGELRLQGGDYEAALQIVDEGMEEIRDFFREFNDPELIDSSEELQALDAWADEIRADRPTSLKQRLSQRLQQAVAEEKYEQAARLRDRLRVLGKQSV